MVETPGNNHKKLAITEQDVCSLLQRYPAAAILTLLREVAQYPEVDINWDALLNKTATGIKSARELRLLWRHLAYRRPLRLPIAPFDDDDDDDDDSDLEFQVQAFPPLTTEAAMDAAACVKVLASGSTGEYCLTNNANVEGDMPNGHVSKLALDNAPASSLNVTQFASTPIEGVDANGAANNSRKKRKWTQEEDSKLDAAVLRHGEGNWGDILKHGHWGRTAGQLYQRWTKRKKQGSANVGAAASTGPPRSETQLAVTNRAIGMAVKDNITAVGNGAAGTNNPTKPKPSKVESAQRQVSQTSSKAATRPPVKKAPPKPPSISDTIQATAVAAGARIVNPSDADALRNYANVRFFRTGQQVALSVAASNGGQQSAKDKPPAALPKPRTMPSTSTLCSSASANDCLPKKPEEKPFIEANVACAETKQLVRSPQENNASLPRFLPKAPPVKSQSTSAGVTKQTAAIGNSQSAISKGNTANEGKDETLKQLVVDVTHNLSTTQGSCVIGKLQFIPSSIVDGSAAKMEVSCEGLTEAKESNQMD